MATEKNRTAALNWRRARFVSLMVLSALMVLLIAFSLYNVRQELVSLASSGDDELSWNISRLELENQRFINAVSFFVADPTSANRAQVMLRSDILFHRISLVYGLTFDGHLTADLLSLRDSMEHLEARLESAQRIIPNMTIEQAREIQEQFRVLESELFELSQSYIFTTTDVSNQALAALQRNYQYVLVLLIAVAIIIMFYTAILVQEVRHSRKLRDLAETASEAKSRFLANMSHEMRTPLNGIIGLTELLQDTQLNAQQQRYLVTLGQTADNLLKQISDVLDLSKIEAEQFELEEEDFNLRGAITDIHSLVVAMLRQRQNTDTRFELNLADDIPKYARGDWHRVRQILLNLLSNSVKFTESGIIRLSASVQNARNGQFLLEFEVSDTGLGIPDEFMPQLFSEFSQADVSTTRKYGGTGLGLALSRRIARLMGGDLRAYQENGPGTTFVLEVRMKMGQEPRLVSDDSEDSVVLQGCRVLVAEDNSVNQMVVRKMLESLSADVYVVGDGHKALTLMAEQGPFDVILMDIHMPGMDGFVATRKIRRIEQDRGWSRQCVVAVTANALAGDRHRCLAAGMDYYLAKPFKIAELKAALEQRHKLRTGL